LRQTFQSLVTSTVANLHVGDLAEEVVPFAPTQPAGVISFSTSQEHSYIAQCW
jgi:hypothetical protein